MGGRGSGSGGGSFIGGSSGKSVNIQSELDAWSYRHNPNNEPFVDAINTSARTIEDDFPGFMGTTVNQVNAATLGGADKYNTLGYYNTATRTVALNTNYTDVDKMNAVYDQAVATGFHPGRGSKSGTEAVALHELGHALTSHVGDKMGITDFDNAARTIVGRAYAASNGKGGAKAWAKKISGYAAQNDAECIAEAVADFYCNGNNARSQSKAIVAELRRYA